VSPRSITLLMARLLLKTLGAVVLFLALHPRLVSTAREFITMS
jgi:hypothetical protein